MEDDVVGVRAAAKILGVHENTVRNWEENGILSCMRLPYSGYRRFPRDEIERVRREMLEGYAPVVEMPAEARVNVRGRVVEGDEL